MKQRFFTLSPLALLSLLPAPSASASTLISNLGQPDSGGAEGYLDTTIRYAWDFQTGASAASVTAITMRLLNLDSIDHTITSQIWTNNGSNQPGAFVAALPNISVPAGTPPTLDLTAASSGVSLAANTIYWIVTGMGENLANFPAGPGNELATGENTDAGGIFSSVPATDLLFSGNSGGTWSLSTPNDIYYKLEGTVVPEPTAAFLLAAAVPFVMRRRR